MTTRIAYRLDNIPPAYVDAIQWNGNRYSTSDILWKHLFQNEDTCSWYAEFTEPEAWEIYDAWESENGLSNVSGDCWSYFHDNLIAKIV